MITTIQLDENVKKDLDRMKETPRETYEQVIVKMIHLIEERKRRSVQLLIEGCKETSEESFKISKEFEVIEDGWEW